MLAPRIPRDVPKPHREPRPGMSRDHLAWIRQLPCCCVCPSPPPHMTAHHLCTIGEHRAAGRRELDRWTVPMCAEHHRKLHDTGSKNHTAWFAERGVDDRGLAQALWRVSGDLDAGLRLIYRARYGGRLG